MKQEITQKTVEGRMARFYKTYAEANVEVTIFPGKGFSLFSEKREDLMAAMEITSNARNAELEETQEYEEDSEFYAFYSF